MDIVYSVIVISITVLALAQGQSYLRDKAVKRYFRENDLKHVLVCDDSNMKAAWEGKIDKEKYDRIEILSIDSVSTPENLINSKYFQTAVRKVGVMKYPCLLTLEGSELKGRNFEG